MTATICQLQLNFQTFLVGLGWVGLWLFLVGATRPSKINYFSVVSIIIKQTMSISASKFIQFINIDF
jgi:hypothetical protein